MSVTGKANLRYSIVTVCFKNLDEVIGTYNSIVSQNEKEIEWILVDGSQSPDIKDWFENFAGRSGFPAKLISEKDDGVYDGMNKGLAVATGLYVTFLNSGDQFASNDVLQEVGLCLGSLPTLIYGDAIEVYGDSEERVKLARSWEKCGQGMFAHHQAMFYLRDAVSTCKYEPYFKVAADYQFTCNLIIKNDFTAIYLKKNICKFSMGGLSFQSSVRGRKEAFCIRVLTLNQGYLIALFVYFVQWAAFFLKRNLPFIYKIFRYTRIR